MDDLGNDYAAAWDEWSATDADAWETTAAGDLDEADMPDATRLAVEAIHEEPWERWW